MRLTPEVIVAIDPKLVGSGYAIAIGHKLVGCGLAKVPRDMRDLEGRIERQAEIIGEHVRQACPRMEIETVVGEFPVVYPGSRAVGDPNDLVHLAGLVCGIAGRLRAPRTVFPTPREWKGQIPKDVHHKRLALEHPRAVPLVNEAAPRAQRHDIYDAVGLLYWYLDRCGLGGIPKEGQEK